MKLKPPRPPASGGSRGAENKNQGKIISVRIERLKHSHLSDRKHLVDESSRVTDGAVQGSTVRPCEATDGSVNFDLHNMLAILHLL